MCGWQSLAVETGERRPDLAKTAEQLALWPGAATKYLLRGSSATQSVQISTLHLNQARNDLLYTQARPIVNVSHGPGRTISNCVRHLVWLLYISRFIMWMSRILFWVPLYWGGWACIEEYIWKRANKWWSSNEKNFIRNLGPAISCIFPIWTVKYSCSIRLMAEDQHIGSADKFSPCILNENISANFSSQTAAIRPSSDRGRPYFQPSSRKLELDSRNLEWKIISNLVFCNVGK